MTQTPLSFADTAKARAEVEARLSRARAALERHPATEAETNFARGQVHALRDLLGWIDPPKPPAPEPDNRRLSEPPPY